MSKDTIAGVAQNVLADLGRPASIAELYGTIVQKNLYVFNTPTPEHVLRTTIRRHTSNVERSDSNEEILFEMVGDEIYGLQSGSRVPGKRRMGLGMKRILRANDKEDLIKALTSEKFGIFREIWRLLLFAAQIGVRNNVREKLSAVDPGKGIDQTTFGNCPAWPGVLYLMSLVETEKASTLSGTVEADDERVAIFQEYANGGLKILQDFFAGRPIDLDGLLAFIETQKEDVLGRPDLELTI